ncbi:DNA polymerase III subunit alpha [Mycoplasmoides pirum]|uniref:DNA polymerase III subunit alpha n=1 Tax=Mycoplasmoides pirum TaxID=2122 RepID=UPI000695E6E0|nr:DNA polymerase III subunit alpha [Mycoplasmoides pirum]
MFINLNVRSSYSLLLSTLSINDIVQFAIQNKQKYVVLTDYNVLYGTVEFFDLATKNNLIPVIGIEIFHEKSDSNLVLYAKTNVGYKNLLKISSNIMTKLDFDLNKYLDDVAVVVKSGNFEPKKSVEYYIANSNDNNGIAFQEVNCLTNEDKYLINILNAIKHERVFQSKDEIYDDSQGLPFLLEKEANKKYSKNQLNNIDKLLNNINLDINKIYTNLLKFPTPKKVSSRVYLQTLCKEGLKKRFHNINVIPKEYIDRLKHELDIINSMNFNDYFLIVHDFINWSRKENIIVGPGRGSVVGSLVAYSLYITEVDPLKFNLIFERFLNPERKSLPDIDVDIMDTRREEVIDYLFNKYGQSHTSQILTFQRIKSKMAIRDVGRVLNIDLKEIDVISKLINSKYDDDLQLAIDKTPKLKQKTKEYLELFTIAKKLINLPRQIGTHAAGIILSNEEITNIIPIQLGLNDRLTSQFSMEYLERFGLLKMDLLGLKNLTILDNIIKLIKKTNRKEIILNNIPIDDKKTFDLFCLNQTNGIFQFESAGMKRVLKMMQPKSIEDLSLVSSLYRPGPQDNIPLFINRRNKKEKITYISNDLKPFLENTEGIIVYQEQVIQIAQAVANFSLAEADIFRRAISKKEEDKLVAIQSNFINAAVKNKYSVDDANKIYQYILHFANYGFNHSHAIAYSLLGYWLAYFKAHYPLEFYVTILEVNVGDENKVNLYVNESKNKNIDFLMPDINLSQQSFSILNNKIIFGFNSIKGIGNESIKKILLTRNNLKKKLFSSYIETIRLLHENKISQKMLENLIYAGCLDSFSINRKTMINNLSTLLKLSLFGNNVDNSEYKIEEFEMDDQETHEYQEIQQNLLGINFEKNSIELIKEKNNIQDIIPLIDIQNKENGYYSSLIKINFIKVWQTKNNKTMAFINIEDNSLNNVELISWNFSYEKYKQYLLKNQILLIGFKKDLKGIYLTKIFKIYDEKKEKLVDVE